jgi:hypothetical protein
MAGDCVILACVTATDLMPQGSSFKNDLQCISGDALRMI